MLCWNGKHQLKNTCVAGSKQATLVDCFVWYFACFNMLQAQYFQYSHSLKCLRSLTQGLGGVVRAPSPLAPQTCSGGVAEADAAALVARGVET